MKKIFAIVLTFTLFLSLINLPLATADNAGGNTTGKDWTNSLPFQMIKHVELYVDESFDDASLLYDSLNAKPVAVTEKLDKNTKIYMKLYFDFDQTDANGDTMLKENDYFDIQLPQQFDLTQTLDTSLYIPDYSEGKNPAEDVVEAIHAEVQSGNNLRLTFKKAIENEPVIENGFIELALGFDKSQVGKKNPTEIQFTIPGNPVNQFTIPLYFELDKPSILKEKVNFDSATNEATWKITVNKEDAIVKNGEVSDNLPSGLKLVDNSFSISPAIDVANENYKDSTKAGFVALPDSAGFDYYFPEEIDKAYTIEFKTKVDTSLLVDPANNGKQLEFTNEASLLHDDIQSPLTSSASVKTDKVKMFSKAGEYHESTHTIDWTFTINESGGHLPKAWLEDELPAYLTLVDYSYKYVHGSTDLTSSISTTKTALADNREKLTFDLGTITEKAVLTFTTYIDEAFYKQSVNAKDIKNTAYLYWGYDGTGGYDGKINSEGIVGNVGVAPIYKSTTGYNASTGRISWKITANPNFIKLNDITIRDIIASVPDHDLLVDSMKLVVYKKAADGTISSVQVSNSDLRAGSNFVYNQNSTADISEEYWEYLVSGETTDKYEFTFDTQITSTDVYQNNDVTSTFKNTAYLYEKFNNANVLVSSYKAENKINSNVLKKEGTYNYETNVFSWKLTLNANKNNLSNVQFTDAIPAGLEYVPGTFKVDGITVSDDTAVGNDTVYNATARQLNYVYHTLNTTSVITFETKLPKSYMDAHFLENKNYPFTNTAQLKHDGLSKPVAASKKIEVKNTLISKEGKLDSGKEINWVVHINNNSVDFESFRNMAEQLSIVDELPSNLKLDTESIQLYHESINADGSYKKGARVENVYDSNHIKYNSATNRFEFILPDDASGGYTLEFTTIITGAGTVNNKVFFAGSQSTLDNTAAPVAFDWAKIKGSASVSRGSIIVEKQDTRDASMKLEGAEFVLLDRNGNEVDRAVTDANGIAEFNDLRLSTPYKVKEVKAPEGYLLNSEAAARDGSAIDESLDISATLTIPSSGTKSLTYTATNEIKRGSISFTKYGYENVRLEGAEFTLYDANNKSVATATSNAEGVVTFTDIAKGNYTIKETKAPVGYRLLTEVLSAIVVNEKVTVSPISGAAVSNEIKRGKVTLTKVDGENNKVLEGAVFSIYKDTDTTPLDQATTASDGKLVFNAVPYGNYIIKEVSPPEGYLANETVYHASITEDGQDVPITVSNQVIKGNIEFTKLGLNNKPLENAVFELYDANNASVQQATSDANGKVRFNDVRYGSYTIKEITAPTGYFVSSAILSASILVDGDVVTTTPNTLVNEPYRSDVKLLKVNPSNAPLQGGVFEIYDVTDTDFLTAISSATSDSDGIVLFKDIPYGNYVVKEVQAPSGYLINRDLLSVSIVADSLTYNLGSFKNEPQPVIDLVGTVNVKKVNPLNQPLAGAVFGLFTPSNKLVATSTTNKLGVAKFSNVDFGNYVIKELQAPTGYILSNKSYDVDVFSIDKPVEFTVVNEQLTGTIVVNIVDDQDKPISNVVIGLYDEQGNEVAKVTSDSEGNAIFTDIPYGNYTIKQLEVPEGYTIDTESKPVSVLFDDVVSTIKFVNYDAKLLENDDSVVAVENNNSVNINNGKNTVANSHGTISKVTSAEKSRVNDSGYATNSLPKTGDSITTKVILFVISVVSIISIVVFSRRKKQHSV